MQFPNGIFGHNSWCKRRVTAKDRMEIIGSAAFHHFNWIDSHTVIAWMATWGSAWPIRRIIARIQSFAFFEFPPTLSHISIMTSHCSDVFVSLVALSARESKEKEKNTKQIHNWITLAFAQRQQHFSSKIERRVSSQHTHTHTLVLSVKVTNGKPKTKAIEAISHTAMSRFLLVVLLECLSFNALTTQWIQ